MYLPAAQFVQELTADVEYFPLSQTEQAVSSESAALLTSFFPAAQSVHDADDAAEYFPSSQAKHAIVSSPVAFSTSFFPAAQLMQAEPVPEYFPTPHETQLSPDV